MFRCILLHRWHVRGLVKTCWGTFCVFSGIGWMWSTFVEINFASLHARELFIQHILRCIFFVLIGMGGIFPHMLRYNFYYLWHGRGSVNTSWGTLMWRDGFGELMFRHGWCLFNTRWDTFCFLDRIEIGLVNTSWYMFCFLAGMGTDWSTHVEMHFVSLLAWMGFGQHKLWYISCPWPHEIGLFNSS